MSNPNQQLFQYRGPRTAEYYNCFFNPNICHVCKCVDNLISCDRCCLISYCSNVHKTKHHKEHEEICIIITQVSNVTSQEDMRRQQFSNWQQWIRSRNEFMEAIQKKLKRPMEVYEQQMILWSKTCVVCHQQTELKTCQRCFSANHCDQHAESFPKKHNDAKCDQLMLLLNIDIENISGNTQNMRFHAEINIGDTWSESIKAIQNQGCPVILSSTCKNQARNEIIKIQETLNIIKEPYFNGKNYFAGLVPHKNPNTGDIYFRNEHLIFYDDLLTYEVDQDRRRFSNRQEWIQSRKELLELVKLNLCRPLETYELQIILWSKSCIVCHQQAKLHTCQKCFSANYCDDHATDFGVKHDERNCEEMYKFCTEFILIQRGNVNLIAQDYVMSDYLSGPLTVYSGLKRINVLSKGRSLRKLNLLENSVVIHIIAANSLDRNGLEAWEILLHLLPDVQELVIIMIGPELSYDMKTCDLCNRCKEQKTLSFFSIPLLYHNYNVPQSSTVVLGVKVER
ncbi:PREDICTED: uncharacterized protein LOC106747659 [Dinoponera quadriceps]|uniref:Uncharacterized protein LOC106747659 n=1 Tax=Dinoponera quadriceps TaxID=609295 RepID=A0A6P3XQU4_DINQU|nr:PREDICTED: uncharacterized protein LOC106747659 [Dinoponera quadriceps]